MNEPLTIEQIRERLQYSIDEIIAHDINELLKKCSVEGDEVKPPKKSHIYEAYIGSSMSVKNKAAAFRVLCLDVFNVKYEILKFPRTWDKEYETMAKDAYLQTMRSKKEVSKNE